MPEKSPLGWPLALGPCTPEEWPALLAVLDAEFVHARGRTGSLAGRFPAAVGADCLANVIVARREQAPVSCCIVREFNWHAGSAIWRGGMTGMVYTVPAARGRGLAARVLDEALRVMKAREVDFAVLWSGLGHFYENLGWVRHDRGVFGTLELAEAGTELTTPAIDGLLLEARRRREQSCFVPRDERAWRANPLPAMRTVCLHAGDAAGSYLLVGEHGGTRYIHEAGGPPGDYAGLWRLACENAARVHVNEILGSPFHRWLAHHTAMRFTGQSLAHWRMVSHRAHRAPWRNWSLPWFDRI